jgi:hypothetical protein
VIRMMVALLLCSAVAQAAGGALLSASGQVLVNNIESKSAALVPGDKILIGDDSFASITEQGASVVLGKNTSSTMDKQKLILNQGSASVTTTNAFPVQAGAFTVVPQRPSAHYEVSLVHCKASFVAHEAALKLSDGSVVAAGSSATRAEPGCAASNDPAPGATTAASSSSPYIIGGTVVGGSALAAYLSSRQPKASPSQPSR